jgi:hypothetical protein
MNEYFKYSVLNNSAGNQQIEFPSDYVKPDIKDITEHSTPKEMSTFITKKLVESIEQDLTTTKDASAQTKGHEVQNK